MGNIKNFKNVKNDMSESPTAGSRASSNRRAEVGKRTGVAVTSRRRRPNEEMQMFNQFILGRTDLTDEERDEITRQ